jgi:4-hydroxybenzoate polyprenyltransferase
LTDRAATPDLPLVLDVDGTLLNTDLLYECFWAALGRAPVRTLMTVFRYALHPAGLKARLAELAELDVNLLPVNAAVGALAREARRQGRDIVLASGSDQSLVRAIAQRLEFPGGHLASDGTVNLTGKAKARALTQRFGKGGFAYAGDSQVDLPVWQAAGAAYAVGISPNVRIALARSGIAAVELGRRWRFRDLLKGLRVHQWIKNVLLFLPLLAAHRTDAAGINAVLLGAIAYSAAASSIYVVNDLLDLSADRRHETKHSRAFASGKVPIRIGMAAGALLGMLALALSAALSWGLFGIILLYIVLSLAYSLKLKRMRWVDVAVLAALYSLRVIAGAIAASVAASGWLIAFVFPVFLALGCVKRLTELGRMHAAGPVPGRGYSRDDRGDLLNVAITAAVAAMVVFVVYTYGETASTLYASLWELRLVALPVGLWLTRMIHTGWKGTQDHDPIVFALRDWKGLVLVAVTLALIFHAALGTPVISTGA